MQPHSSFMERIASPVSGSNANSITLMREEVDFTERGTRLSIDADGAAGAAAARTTRAFPFSVRLQPAGNVQNGLLDSFHGRTLGLAFVLRCEMRRASLFKAAVDDAIEIIVEADPAKALTGAAPFGASACGFQCAESEKKQLCSSSPSKS